MLLKNLVFVVIILYDIDDGWARMRDHKNERSLNWWKMNSIKGSSDSLKN